MPTLDHWTMTAESFALESSIPVLRMLDESLTRDFYLAYLGYEIDWEHRFGEDETSPLYMQIHRGDSVIHLNGHADEDSSICEVRIPVRNLQSFCDYLCTKEKANEKLEIVDPRYEGRPTDLNLLDPTGNHLVFWTPSRLANSIST